LDVPVARCSWAVEHRRGLGRYDQLPNTALRFGPDASTVEGTPSTVAKSRDTSVATEE
jgi:hypothetical protein